MSYQQLTEGKRYQISALLAQGFTPAAIAGTIKVQRSTVYRELRRNNREAHYDPAQTHHQALKRRCSALKYRIPPSTIEYVELGMPVSHEWIYRYVAIDKAQGGRLAFQQ